MLSEQRNQQLNSILEHTRKMLDACGQEQWESLVSMEDDRRKMVEAFFVPAPEQQESEAVASAIRQMQELDKELIKQCTEARQACLQKLTNIDVGKKVSAAYVDNAG
ncbi:MAG: flagellar protein FliT [Gammaproteobacteria bacterium]|nr:flagellar protein FliT [Gammaproteobacteria bacterium]